MMRPLVLLSGSVVALAAAAVQVSLPAPLSRDFAVLKDAPSLTVEYTTQVVGEAPRAYRLVLSRPGRYRLTGPDATIVSDGKTVVAYDKETNTYNESPASALRTAAFASQPEVFAWAPFLLEEPGKGIATATAGGSRTILGSPTKEVALTFDKLPFTITLFLDEKLGVARGLLLDDKEKGRQTIVRAKTVEIGKEPLAADAFAFAPPDGATKAAAVAMADYAGVQALLTDRCLPCHSAGGHRAGVVLDGYDGVAATVVPGDPAGSLLVKSVKGDGVRKMPLGNHPALSDAEVKLVSDWIAAGAKKG